MESCPAEALERREEGLVFVNDEKCVGCGECLETCMIGAIRLHPERNTPLICDHCGGKPLCVEKCPTKALLITGFLGGRGFNSKRLYDEVPKDVDPLSPQNKLMFATGPLVGTAFPLGARFNISAKSPLTGILGDSNAGGHFAAEMKFAGYDQIIIEGKTRKPSYIFIEDQEIQMKDAEHLVGKDVYETTETIRKDLGERTVQVATVGPAAENRVLYAGIFANLSRPAARTGIGTVRSIGLAESWEQPEF